LGGLMLAGAKELPLAALLQALSEWGVI